MKVVLFCGGLGTRIREGQRIYAPRKQAGHMTAADQIVRSPKKRLPLGAVADVAH
jgi:hypothetical protein